MPHAIPSGMRKLTLIIQALALVVFLAVAMLAHGRHRTAPAIIRFDPPSPAVDVERNTPETGSKHRLKQRALRPPMLTFVPAQLRRLARV